MAYVHWYMKTGDVNALRYERALEDLKSKAWSTKAQNLMKKRVKAQYGLKTDKDFKDFLDISASLIGGTKSDFAQMTQMAFKSLSQFKSLNQQGIQNLTTKVKTPKDLNMLGTKVNDMFQIMDKFIAFCSNFYSQSSGQDFLAFLLSENLVTGKTKSIFQSIINTKQARLFDGTESETSRKGASQIFKEMYSKIRSTKNGNFKSYVIQEYNNQSGKERTLGTIINSYYNFMAQTAGSMYEILLDVFLNVKLIELMKKNAPKNVKITSASTKDSSKYMETKYTFLKPTVDLTLGIEGAQINFKSPIGLSVKRSTRTDKNNIDIHIKSSTLGKLLTLSRNYGLWNETKHGEAFYNIVANHRRHKTPNPTGGGGGTYYYYQGDSSDNALSPIFKSMNKMFLIFGLAGALSEKDLATYILVNNKVYSIYEILSKLDLPDFSTSGISNAMQEKIRAKHRFYYKGEQVDTTPNMELAKERTRDLIQKNIFKQSLSMNLKLNLTKLNLNRV